MTEGGPKHGGVDDSTPHPMISIIMPTYNAERYLAASLWSVLQQDFPHFEVLVVDDHSTDGSAAVAQDFASNDPRVRCMTNLRNKGVSGARNTGLDCANGDWVAFLDSDDLLTAGSLRLRMEFIARTPECRILATDHSYIDEAGVVTVERRFTSVGLVEAARRSVRTNARDFCLEDPIGFFLDEFCLMWTGSILLHRSVIDQAGRFDETMSHGEDTRYWFQAALHHPVHFLDWVSVQYRQSATSASADMQKALIGRELFYRKLRNDSDFVAYRSKATRRLAMAICERAYYFRQTRRFWLGTSHSLRALAIAPTNALAWRNLAASVLRKP